MPRRSRKYTEARGSIDRVARHSPKNALGQVKQMAYAKFDESIEVAAHLGVDPRRADQIVRGTVVLPHGTGKSVRVLAICQGDKVDEASEAGAEFIGVDYVAKIKEGWLGFDVCVATPDMMRMVGPLGRILGPRGLMPTPKAGTVTPDVGRAIREIKGGKIEYRVDKTGNLHAPIGRVSFEVDSLEENLNAFMSSVLRAKPSAAKGTYVKSVTVASTMGPGVPVDPNSFSRSA